MLSRSFYRPRRSHNNGGQSDAESDASGISWASGLHSSHRRRNESGSESERSVRRTHRSRRKRYNPFFCLSKKCKTLVLLFIVKKAEQNSAKNCIVKVAPVLLLYAARKELQMSLAADVKENTTTVFLDTNSSLSLYMYFEIYYCIIITAGLLHSVEVSLLRKTLLFCSSRNTPLLSILR